MPALKELLFVDLRCFGRMLHMYIDYNTRLTTSSMCTWTDALLGAYWAATAWRSSLHPSTGALALVQKATSVLMF